MNTKYENYAVLYAQVKRQEEPAAPAAKRSSLRWTPDWLVMKVPRQDLARGVSPSSSTG